MIARQVHTLEVGGSNPPPATNIGWNAAKVQAFRSSFMDFLKHVKINSKETGGDTVLADHVYEAQRRFLDCIFEGLANDIHDFKILKSRQLGISTMSRALSIFWLGMHAGLQGAMVFDTQAHRAEARNEIMTMIRSLPSHLKFPTIKGDSRDMLTLSNGATLRFLNAGVRKSKSSGTLGRSSGLNFAHNSEMCSWENDEGIVSYKNALSENYPDRLYIWESTARGFGSWWKMWREAKSDDLNQKTCFITWYHKESQRIKRGTPMFERYGMKPHTEEEQKRIDTVKELYDYDIDDEQLAWYRRKSDPTASNDNEEDLDTSTEELVQQEQPWTEDEAFLQTGSTFFPGEKLTGIMKATVTDKYDGYSFVNGFDFLNCDWIQVAQKRQTQLKIWEPVDPDGIYVVAADPAFGHDENNNNSAIEVLRCYADCVEQVAEYANASIQTQPFAWVIASLAAYYKNSMVILEINGPGEAVWNEYKSLKQLVVSGYLRSQAFEKGLRDIFNNVRDYMFARSDSTNPIGSCYHWVTNSQRKVAIFERLRDFVSNATLTIRSVEVIDEMKTIVRNGDAIGSEGRNRDDRTFCLAIGIRAWEQSIRRMMSTAGRTKAHEVMTKRITIKDQIGMFNTYKLTSFFKKRASQRTQQNALLRRRGWRER